ncbi:MAG: phage tail tape measure protein [archaeon]|nr:phage tail tape measure protein [archaeon]
MGGKIRPEDIIQSDELIKDLSKINNELSDSAVGIDKVVTELKKLNEAFKTQNTTQATYIKRAKKVNEADKKLAEEKKKIKQAVESLDRQRQRAYQNQLKQDVKEKERIKRAKAGEEKKALIAQKKAVEALDRQRQRAYQNQLKRETKEKALAKKRKERLKQRKLNIKSLKNLAMGYFGLTAAISGTIALVKNAIQVNRDFEKTFTNVLTLLDEADKNKFGRFLEQGAIDLVAEYGLEIQDVNKALFDAISAGVPAGEAIAFLSKNAELAIGGVTSLGTAVDGSTSILNAYKLGFENTDSVTSAFFTAQKFGKTTVEELSNSIGNVAPIAAQAGVGYKELLASFAQLTKQGIKTDQAANAIKASITALINPSEDAQKVFNKLGIETGAVALKQNGFANTLAQVSAAAETNGDLLSELIPNVRALTGVGALGTESLASMDDIMKELNVDFGEGSSLQAAFNEQTLTGAAQSAQLKGEWQKLLITVGGGESVFKKIGSSIKTGLSDKIKSVTESIGQFTGGGWLTKFKILINSFVNSAFSPFKHLSTLIEKLTGKKISFEFDIPETKKGIELINDTIVEENENLTKELTEEEIKRQKELQAIRDRAAKIDIEKKKLKKDKILELKDEEFDDLVAEIDKESDAIVNAELERAAKLARLREEQADEELRVQQELTSLKIELANSLFDFTSVLRDRQLAKLEAAEQKELENAGDNEEKKEEIEKKFAKKKAALREKQAKMDKIQGIFNASINMALGITNALSKVVTAPLVPFIAALGAIQIATIAAQPIPKFAKGVIDFAGGQAVVGEEGKELIKTNSGLFISPDKPTLVDLPKGSDVIPHHETMNILQGNNDNKLNELISETKQTRQALLNRPENKTSLTHQGLKRAYKDSKQHINYIDTYFRK